MCLHKVISCFTSSLRFCAAIMSLGRWVEKWLISSLYSLTLLSCLVSEIRMLGLPHFIVLHFVVLYRCCIFYKLFTNFYTSKRIATHFIAMLTLLRCSGSESAISEYVFRFSTNQEEDWRSVFKYPFKYLCLCLAPYIFHTSV